MGLETGHFIYLYLGQSAIVRSPLAVVPVHKHAYADSPSSHCTAALQGWLSVPGSPVLSPRALLLTPLRNFFCRFHPFRVSRHSSVRRPGSSPVATFFAVSIPSLPCNWPGFDSHQLLEALNGFLLHSPGARLHGSSGRGSVASACEDSKSERLGCSGRLWGRLMETATYK